MNPQKTPIEPTKPEPKTIYVNYFDAIVEPKAKALMAICSDIVAQHQPDVLYFLFSSPGGSVSAGIVLYNFLRALPVKIVMHNTGSIDSIATVIFMSAEQRYAALHSTFLFHGVMAQFPPNSALSHSGLHERLSHVKHDENKIAGIISERSKLTETEIRDLFLQGEAKDLAFAMEKGIIHEIKNPAIPKGAQFVTVNLN
jgi:ATP-dependent Clp protease protease subunit